MFGKIHRLVTLSECGNHGMDSKFGIQNHLISKIIPTCLKYHPNNVNQDYLESNVIQMDILNDDSIIIITNIITKIYHNQYYP